MGSIFRKSALLAAALLVTQGASAWAASVEVQVPFSFSVSGHSLPAGKYLVETNGSAVMIRGEHGTHGGAVLMTTPATGHDPAGDEPALTFTQSESQYQLSGIWESATDGQAVMNRHKQ